MKLAFSGKARHTDFSDGYELYKARSKKGDLMDEAMYHRVIKDYCSTLADTLCETGMTDLPRGIGMIVAAQITRKAQYHGKKFVGYGKIDWETGRYDGKLKTFGLVFLPKGKKNQSMRCFGFVANRKLFKKMKSLYESRRPWELMNFKDEMI